MDTAVLPAAAAEKYEIGSCVKKSRFSSSYIAYDKDSGRRVFLKIGDTGFVGNEARMLEKLKGKGIPEVYDFFERDGAGFLFRSYIEGENLRECIKEHGHFSAEDTVRIGIGVCEILSRMHGLEPPVIHRDIKSENIVLTPGGEVCLVDLGISREYDFNASRDTQVMGTPAAAPPEQFGYGQTDERSDIYAVGVLLNELATGSVKVSAKQIDPAKPLHKRLSAVIRRCTEFDPDKRYKNAAECKRALLKIQKRSFPAIVPIASAVCAVCTAAILLAVFNADKNKYEPPENITEITASETSETSKTASSGGTQLIEFDGGYIGDWEYGYPIPKGVFDGFDGDAEITLEIETVEEGMDGSYYMFVPINTEDRWEKLALTTLDNRSDDGMWIVTGKNQPRSTFTLSRDVIDTLGDGGFDFQIYNLIIKSASVKEAVNDEVPCEIADTKAPYTVQLDSEYMGDYALCGVIPKSVLENYKGDIKISYEIEVGGRYNYANFVPIALSGDEATWTELTEEIKSQYQWNEYGFLDMEKGQTECTIIVSHEAIEKCGRYGMGLKAANIIFRSATLCDADED